MQCVQVLCFHFLSQCTQVLVDCPSRKIIDSHYLALDLAHQIKFPGERIWTICVEKYTFFVEIMWFNGVEPIKSLFMDLNVSRYVGCDSGADLHATHSSIRVGGVRHVGTHAAVLLCLFPLCTKQEKLQVRLIFVLKKKVAISNMRDGYSVCTCTYLPNHICAELC